MLAALLGALAALSLASWTAATDISYSPLELANSGNIWKNIQGVQDIPIRDQCNARIIAQLDTRECQDMNDDAKTRYAIELFNCQLRALDREELRCYDYMSNAECTRSLPRAELAIIVSLKASVSAHCYEAQRLMWYVLQKNTLFTLSQTTSDTLSTLQDVEERQEQLAENATVLLDEIRFSQADLLSRHDALSAKMSNAAASLEGKLNQAIVNEQQLLRNQLTALNNQEDMLQKAKDTQYAVSGVNMQLIQHREHMNEFVVDAKRGLEAIRLFEEQTGITIRGFTSVMFHVGILLLVILMTTPEQLKDGRIWGLGIMMCVIAYEYNAMVYLDGPEELRAIWIARKVGVALSVLSILLSGLFYQDPRRVLKSIMDEVNYVRARLSEGSDVHQYSLYEYNDAADSDYYVSLTQNRDSDVYANYDEDKDDDDDEEGDCVGLGMLSAEELQEELAEINEANILSGRGASGYALRPSGAKRGVNALVYNESADMFIQACQIFGIAMRATAASFQRANSAESEGTSAAPTRPCET